MADARETAVSALFSIDKGQWSENRLAELIDSAALDRRDAAFCTALCEGTLQNRLLIDHQIAACSSQRLNKISPYVLNVLRCAVYQFEFMERVPVSAAVNTAVELARKSTNPRAAAYVNAMLRRLSTTFRDIPLPEGDRTEYLSVKYSHPAWLVRALAETAGEDGLEALLAANNTPAKTCIRVNTLKSNTAEVRELLQREGMEVTRHEYLPNALLISKTGSIAASEAFRRGLFTVQDAASQLCAEALGVRPGDSFLDVCASPGGKSFAVAAATGNGCAITACDINKRRLKPLTDDAERLGVTCLTAEKSDASLYREDFDGRFDCVLCDVPCSGTGDLRRKPEIRYKDEASIDRLPEVQLKILSNASRYVRPGGTLVYSTCSLLKRENSEVTGRFLAENPGFEPCPFTAGSYDAPEGELTLLPHVHKTDGFFMTKLIKRK